MTEIKKVGILGAGMMGAEIGLCFAMAGCEVALKDVSLEAAEKGKSRLDATLEKAIRAGRINGSQKDAVLGRITPTERLDLFKQAEMVVEAVFENFEVKKAIWGEADDLCPEECIFATNTSSIPITQLGTAVKQERRRRFLGTHFFSPASVMNLVEVIPGLETDEAIVEQVMGICRQIGKTPIHVKDVPGFAVNRILHAMWIEANRLVEENVISPEDVDIACKLGLGHPIGPYALMDLTSNELNLQVQEILFQAYGERFRPRPILKQKVHAGHLGRKTSRGWYVYNK
jgi:3-hydroxybutyryl-CoA dehydrogenase